MTHGGVSAACASSTPRPAPTRGRASRTSARATSCASPPTRPLHLEGLDLTLNVWDGVVDIVTPFYPRAELVSECRPVDEAPATIEVAVRYQACDDASCLAPKTERFSLDVGLEPVDMPNLSFHGETGQRKSAMDGAPHLRKLVLRQLRRHPLGALRSIVNQVRLRIAGELRARRGRST